MFKKKIRTIFLIGIFAIAMMGCERAVGTITITQYPDQTGSQAMFYTIENQSGDLIIVDGGMVGNAEYVKSVIEEKGSHVSAWILTHPHPDHIGAFNVIYADLGDIRIDNIYTIDMDYELYKQYAQPWDNFDTYQTFYDLTASAENITYLHTGDEVEICGCLVKVYSAYDDTIINYSSDLANSGSLVFEIFSENTSMLFCSDVYGEEMCNKIIEAYGDELSATYLQMGHHGNNSITKDFLLKVQPEGAFFDAPAWLVQGEQYDTLENILMVEEIGATAYSYMSAPNEIVLE